MTTTTTAAASAAAAAAAAASATTATTGITDGCSPLVLIPVVHKGVNLASVTESSISSEGVCVSGFWSSPAASAVLWFPED